MIPSLIFLLLRRYRKRYPEKAKSLLDKLRFAARIGLLLLLTICLALYAYAQEQVLQYTVKRSGNPIGSLVLKESRWNKRVTYHLQSSIKTSFLFTITARGVEEAAFENGILVRAFFYQKVNGNERANTRMQASESGYMVVRDNETKPLRHYPITYNMVCLYTMEPLHRATVFSDKFQQLLPIETLGPHHYKITFPDGGYNEYFYQSGICTTVKEHGAWFSAEMVLKK